MQIQLHLKPQEDVNQLFTTFSRDLKSHWICYLQNVIFFMRRGIFVMILLWLQDHEYLQLMIFNLMSMVQLIFIAIVKPFTEQ